MICQFCGKGETKEKKSNNGFFKCNLCGAITKKDEMFLHRATLLRQLIVAGFGGWWANPSLSEVSHNKIIENADTLLTELLGPEPGGEK